MSRASRQNISSVLHDIKHPEKGPRAALKPAKKEKTRRRSVSIRAALSGLAVFVFIVAGTYFAHSSGAFGTVVGSIKNLGDGEKSERDLKDPVLSSDVLVELPGFLGNIGDIIGAIRGIGKDVNELNTRGLALIFSGTGGDEFLDILKRIYTNLGVLNRIGFDVGSYVPTPSINGNSVNEDFLTDTKNLEKGLGAIITFLDVPYERRIVLLFQNHSEIRPTGGFIGSYGEVFLDKGSITNIKVDDIYTPDRNSTYKIVPPKQLQGITTGWGARDANWFFDFPVSAEKVLELLEASEMYIHDGVRFDGAIAINANVVGDILKVIGPIYVPEHDVTLTSENFLLAVREEVETARDENPKENPKQILGLITPTIIERVQNLDENAKTELVLSLLSRAFNKDIQVYFRDVELQAFIAGTPFSGGIYEIPEVFNGDYLAVVDANVAGGKSDIFVDQSIALDSSITLAGQIRNELTVIRSHRGENEVQELYRQNNQNFIKIFTHPNVTFSEVQGTTPKTVVPKINYDASGYSLDPILSFIESTAENVSGLDLESYIESGKKVFAGWFSTPAGETRELKFKYEKDGVFVGSGAQYEFVFDKQSGVSTSLRYIVTAPPGYKWKESGNEVYSYTSDSIPGRLVLNLTLVKED